MYSDTHLQQAPPQQQSHTAHTRTAAALRWPELPVFGWWTGDQCCEFRLRKPKGKVYSENTVQLIATQLGNRLAFKLQNNTYGRVLGCLNINMKPTCSITVFSHHWGPIRVMAAMILAWSTPRAQSCRHQTDPSMNMDVRTGISYY